MFRRWINGGVCNSNVRLDGKNVIVTGSNTGIGKETAWELARRGANVIMACRNMEKANMAANEIRSDSTVTGLVYARHLDLSSFQSIHQFAKEILETQIRIDILINNAGIMCPKEKTKDGYDMIFATNHLGPFLLTLLLLDRIKESAPARIINVSSDGHYLSSMNWNDLNYDYVATYSPFKAYCQSKLANILFTRELAEILSGTGVTTYAVHPGLVETEIGRYDQSIFMSSISLLTKPFLKDSVHGAQTTIYCAIDENLQKDSGLYYKDCAEKTPSAKARSSEDAKRLWADSLQMVGLDKSKDVALTIV